MSRPYNKSFEIIAICKLCDRRFPLPEVLYRCEDEHIPYDIGPVCLSCLNHLISEYNRNVTSTGDTIVQSTYTHDRPQQYELRTIITEDN